MRKLKDLVLGKKHDRRHENPGRPKYIADINWTHDPAQFYYDLFYKACHDFTYREMLALSRKLDCSIRTVYRWRDGKSYPDDIGIMLLILDWSKAGKPLCHQQDN